MQDRRSLIFNLCVWAIMLIAAIVLIAKFGSNVPSWDDWDNVPAITHYQPVTWEWLWSQHNEHRDPLPRLIIIALNWYIAMDFRTPMYFDLLASAAVALGLLCAARFARGRSSYLDSFITIVLLNWGQADNFLWGWQVQFYASALIACVVLMLIARIKSPADRALMFGAGACVPLLALCGANGLGLVPALAMWVGYAAVVQWKSKSPTAHRDGAILAAMFFAAAALVGIYFVNYHTVPFHPSNRNLGPMFATAGEFLTMGLGPGIVGLDQFSNPKPFWQATCIAVATIIIITSFMLIWTWWTDRDQRIRASGLLLFIGAMIAIALALGMGRAGFEPRYVTLAAPMMCAIYLAWCIYGTHRVQRFARGAVVAFSLAAIIPNTIWGFTYATILKTQLGTFENEMVAGIPQFRLIHDHHHALHPHDQTLMDYMPMLRDARVGNFKFLKLDPVWREINFPLVPTASWQVIWKDGAATATATGDWPFVQFAIPDDILAYGIRIRYSFTGENSVGPDLVVQWRSKDHDDFILYNLKKFTPTGDYANWRQGTWSRLNDPVTTMDIWCCDYVNTIRVNLFSARGTTKFYNVSVLVPEEDPTTQPSLSQTSSHPASRPLERR